jgi:hypothetical protein
VETGKSGAALEFQEEKAALSQNGEPPIRTKIVIRSVIVYINGMDRSTKTIQISVFSAVFGSSDVV